jgi:hypothetical protein
MAAPAYQYYMRDQPFIFSAGNDESILGLLEVGLGLLVVREYLFVRHKKIERYDVHTGAISCGLYRQGGTHSNRESSFRSCSLTKSFAA